ncbi:hypothetical protein LXA43DRAFT_1026931 [Ganoderma leucocontextum]|nr:hypothetical protein LXA43DRAFT_1026931 [Ganoderma leucocontextum]
MSDPWMRLTLTFVFWVVCCSLRLRAATVVVESTDPAVHYTGSWEPVKLNSTTAYVVSNTTRSKAVYTFAGTRISVFGVVLPRDSPGAAQVSEYSVDGGKSTQYTAPGNATGPVYNLQFYLSGQLQDGQHTITILNLGDEFIIERLEVTTDPQHVVTTNSNSGPTLASIPPEPGTTSTPSSTSSSFLSSSTTQSPSSQTTSTNNGTLTSTNSSTVLSTLLSTSPASITSSTSILPTSSSSPPDSAISQDHSTTLSKGAMIGGGVAGTLGFLCLVGGLCWWGQKRGRRKRQESPAPSDPKPPVGALHVATLHEAFGGRESIAPDPALLRRGPPIYIPIGSASDLSVGGTPYTSTAGSSPSRAAYQSEKYGMDDVPLRSPVISTTNLLRQQASPAHRGSPNPGSPLETPVEVRRMYPDGRRRSADGGVRIAGGRPGRQRVDDTGDSFLDLGSRKSTGSTLPPAYDFD